MLDVAKKLMYSYSNTPNINIIRKVISDKNNSITEILKNLLIAIGIDKASCVNIKKIASNTTIKIKYLLNINLLSVQIL